MHRIKLRRTWVTFGRQTTSGFFVNIYQLGRETHYLGRADGHFYRRTRYVSVCMCEALDGETSENIGWIPCPTSLCERRDHRHREEAK